MFGTLYMILSLRNLFPDDCNLSKFKMEIWYGTYPTREHFIGHNFPGREGKPCNVSPIRILTRTNPEMNECFVKQLRTGVIYANMLHSKPLIILLTAHALPLITNRSSKTLPSCSIRSWSLGGSYCINPFIFDIHDTIFLAVLITKSWDPGGLPWRLMVKRVPIFTMNHCISIYLLIFITACYPPVNYIQLHNLFWNSRNSSLL
jgi:hypothetical protein